MVCEDAPGNAWRTLMRHLPSTSDPPVIRADFTDERAWQELKNQIEQPVTADHFRAYVSFVDDREFEGRTAAELIRLAPKEDHHGFFFVADSQALFDREHAILVVDCADHWGSSFRVIPNSMWSVENNLSLSNMGFEEFADAADSDGVFRGFPEE
nr:putative uncharacterized protein [uncultured bacterium]